jgi:putative acetyltransferase
MIIRPYRIGEEAELYQVFYSSIRENAKSSYTEDQLSAWAPDQIDMNRWRDRMKSINPYVVTENNKILGYADLQSSGYIDHFFVRGGCSKKGIGKMLLLHLIDKAEVNGIDELSADVSLAAQGFFVAMGFELIRRQKVEVRGQYLENALMKLTLKENTLY